MNSEDAIKAHGAVVRNAGRVSNWPVPAPADALRQGVIIGNPMALADSHVW